MIDRPQDVAVDDAARDLASTVRTIWRDLLVLQDAGAGRIAQDPLCEVGCPYVVRGFRTMTTSESCG
jgi:hypothetical protein